MRNKWTNDEIKILVNNYSILDNIELIKLFNGRTLNSIKIK